MPVALGEPSAPVALVVSVMTVNIVTERGRHWPPVLSSSDAGTHSITGPGTGPWPWRPGGREQRNQLRTNKTGAQEEDFLKNCHDIFKIVNIYLSGTNLNICSSRRSRS